MACCRKCGTELTKESAIPYCDTCQVLNETLPEALKEPGKRRFVADILRHHDFTVIDQNAVDIPCPVMCGYCCKESWWTVVLLKKKFPDHEGQCPYLRPHGCKLLRRSRPAGCNGFLCDLAFVVYIGYATVGQAKKLIEIYEGDTDRAARFLKEHDDLDGNMEMIIEEAETQKKLIDTWKHTEMKSTDLPGKRE